MADYMAVLRKHGESTPQKIPRFTAGEDAGSAINEMCSIAKIMNTGELEEFEILKITENGNAYTPVAARIQRKDRGNVAKLVAPTSKPVETKALVPVAQSQACCVVPVSNEEVYTPRTIVNA